VLRVLNRALYLLAVLLFFEMSSRAILRVDWFFGRLAITDSSGWRLRWVRRQSGRLGYGFDLYDPKRGWALRPELRGLRVFSGKILNSDRFGFRGAEEYPAQKPPGRSRILVLGDSFTFGQDVSDDETYASLLERSLKGVDVMNLGVHGYGHDQMLISLQEVGPRVHPDVVLLGFVRLDMERNLMDFRDYAKPRFAIKGDQLVAENVPVPSPDETRRAEFLRSKFADLLRILWDRYAWKSGRNERLMNALTYRILEEIARTSRGLGARPVFAYLPVFDEIEGRDDAAKETESTFLSFCAEHGIDSVNLRPFFSRQRAAGAQLKTVGHWDPVEHQIAAEGIEATLLEKSLLPAREEAH
jgi:hypothetical protein